MITVQTIIDRLEAPVGRLEPTVDRLIAGSPNKAVHKVAVTFSSSYACIREAALRGADLLITHEPTFYSHYDEIEETDWSSGDEVYVRKRQLIEQSGMAIYRFHDYWHRYRPDGILSGLLEVMEWTEYAREDALYALDVPETTVLGIAEEMKRKLGISSIQLIGNPEQKVSTLCLSPGFEGGKRQMGKLITHHADLLIVGETHSWETDEYVMDAVEMGLPKSMLILGHLQSEEAGMGKLVRLLQDHFPELDVQLIPGRSPYVWL